MKRIVTCITLGLILGAAAVAPRAEAYPGERIGVQILSYTKNPTGVSYGLNDNVSWLTDKGHVYQNRDTSYNFQTVMSSVSEDYSWRFLAEGDISGAGKCFAALCDDNGVKRIYIRRADDGSVWANWTYPRSNPDYISGLARIIHEA